MLGRKKRALCWGLFLLVVSVGIILLRTLTPVPLPGLHSAAAAAAHIAAMPDAEQRDAARDYGGLVAKTGSWSTVAQRGAALSPEVQDIFFSAVAYSEFLNGSSPIELLAKLDAHVPPSFHANFCNGLVRLFARDNAASPEIVLDYVDGLSRPCGGADLTDGIRIGVQEALGDKLGEAIAVVGTYPPDLHGAMVEELGWRYGDLHGMDVDAWRSVEDVIPSHNLCSMAGGVTLGAMHRALADEEPWVAGFAAFSEALPQRCQEATMEGLAEALLFVLGPQDSVMKDAVAGLESATHRQQLEKQLAIRLILHEVRQGTAVDEGRMEALPVSQQWHAVHVLGFLAGLEHGYEAEHLFSDAVPLVLVGAFHDGLAHGVVPDWENPEEWVEFMQDMIPPGHQWAHEDALLRAYTEVHFKEPDKVVAFAQRVSTLTGGRALDDGIRIGFQQALGGDMSAALLAAQDYPKALHPVLYEELGWRLGEDEGLSADAWTTSAAGLDESDACVFGAGMIRGVMLQEIRLGSEWVSATSAFSDGLPATCFPVLQQGIAEALLIALGHDGSAMDAAIALTPSPEQIRVLVDGSRDRLVGPTTP